jgi:hypothetical protein
MPRRILITLILLLLAIASIVILNKSYYRYYRTYKPEYKLLESATFLEINARNQLKENAYLLQNIGREFNRTYFTEQQRIQLKKLEAEAKDLHKISSWLVTNLSEDTTIMVYGNKLYTFKQPALKGKEQKEAYILHAQINTSKAHALKVREKLIWFLNATARFSQSRKSQSRYNNLKKLAGNNSEEFYKQVYQSENTYLILPTIAIIRSALVAIEEDCLNSILMKGAGRYNNPIKGILLPYSKNEPGFVTQGDTLAFSARLANPSLNEFRIPLKFVLPEGRIDSISDSSIAYVSIPTGPLVKNKGISPFIEQKKGFSIGFFNAYARRDTFLRAEIKYWVNTGRKQEK